MQLDRGGIGFRRTLRNLVPTAAGLFHQVAQSSAFAADDVIDHLQSTPPPFCGLLGQLVRRPGFEFVDDVFASLEEGIKFGSDGAHGVNVQLLQIEQHLRMRDAVLQVALTSVFET